MCFPCMQLSPYRGNCVPEPEHPPIGDLTLPVWCTVCVCMHMNVYLWCLEHITVGKPNLPAIVLIKAMFLWLSLAGRQHQLHKTTETRRGRLPQPHWHPLWTSPDFKRYSLSDYRVTDWAKIKKREKLYPSNHLYPNNDIWNMCCRLKTRSYMMTTTRKCAHLKVNKRPRHSNDRCFMITLTKLLLFKFVQVEIRSSCMFLMMEELLHKEGVGKCGGGWVGERRAETAHQSALRTPFPPTSCKCSAIHSGRQESAGSHRVRIQQTYFFLLIWAIAASIDWAKAQCSYRRGGERSAEGGRGRAPLM